MALELRLNCECCDRDLPSDSKEAYICTFECTYCFACASEKLGSVCLNCGGELVRRPIRPDAKLINNPASRIRVTRAEPCGHVGPLTDVAQQASPAFSEGALLKRAPR